MGAEKLALFGGAKTVTLPRPKWPRITEEEIAAVLKQMLTGSISEIGREGVIADFENEFAAYQGRKYALSFSSGTASIHGALFAAGVGPGDEVLQTSNTWASAITAILHCNGIPVFCDIVSDGFAIDPEEIRLKASKKAKAVIVTHLWGIPAGMDEILKVAEEKNLTVIEDCSHAPGATYKGRKVGSIGHMGCFSLQGSKSIVAGEGGVMVTDERLFYERAMLPGHHGVRLEQELTLEETKRYSKCGMYWKYRAVPISMAIARVQLKHLDEWNRNRRQNLEYLKEKTKDLDFIVWPQIPSYTTIGFYGTPVFYDQAAAEGVSREVFLTAMQAEGLPLGTGYPLWYLEPIFQDGFFYGRRTTSRKHKHGDLPNTEKIAGKTLILPATAFVTPCTELMDQFAEAYHKVAENIGSLKNQKLLARLQKPNPA